MTVPLSSNIYKPSDDINIPLLLIMVLDNVALHSLCVTVIVCLEKSQRKNMVVDL